MDLNQVILMGNLVEKPEIIEHLNGDVICILYLITSDENRNQIESKTKHKILVRGNAAKMANDRLIKNSRVLVKGKIKKKKKETGEISTFIESEYIDLSSHKARY